METIKRYKLDLWKSYTSFNFETIRAVKDYIRTEKIIINNKFKEWIMSKQNYDDNMTVLKNAKVIEQIIVSQEITI